jgi:hypothetical protein
MEDFDKRKLDVLKQLQDFIDRSPKGALLNTHHELTAHN